MPPNTTPARVGKVPDSQLKDQRIPLPTPVRLQPKLADLFVFVFGNTASRLTRPATSFRCSTAGGLAVGGRPCASRAHAASGLPVDHLDPVLALPVRRLRLLSEGNC